jgi:hypothetical protein
LTCPVCDRPGRLDGPLPAEWSCPGCGLTQPLHAACAEQAPPACVVCENRELYRKKDFPHGLGLALLALACLASAVTYALYHQWLTWAILIGTALFDSVLYLCVGDVVVCYRCGAQYRGLPGAAAVPPFDLGIAERYRQERIRREQLRRR